LLRVSIVEKAGEWRGVEVGMGVAIARLKLNESGFWSLPWFTLRSDTRIKT